MRNPSLANEIWAIDTNGAVWVNHGTQSSPGAWGGGLNDASWSPGSTMPNDPARGIAVFDIPDAACGTHVPFFVGQSQHIYRFAGTSCTGAGSDPGFSQTPGLAGNSAHLDLIESIAPGFVVGTDGNIYEWTISLSNFSFFEPGPSGGAVGVGIGFGAADPPDPNLNGITVFDPTGSPFYYALGPS
jgi:hypothetical protein